MYIPIWVIILAIIVWYYYYQQKKKKVAFSPFQIMIDPHWHTLLTDFKLVDDQSWKEFLNKVDNNPLKYNLIRDGVNFTVLNSDEKSDLIYSNDYKSFHSEVDFRNRISEIEISKDKVGNIFPFSPDFCVKWGIDGYDLYITTPESFEKVIMVGDDNDLIKITTIPYALFDMENRRFGVLKPEELKKMLEKYGWTRKELNGDEELMGWPNEINHKYFKIWYRYI
jgi:hypothetical protein